jgi:alpha-ribazole phosphatase
VRLWLIRHFEPEVASGICYGQTDLNLRHPIDGNADHLMRLKNQLIELGAAHAPIISSPLRRCAQIATWLNSSAKFDDRLRELHFGDWEMQTWDVIGASSLDAWANDLAGFRPPGGETGHELQKRALDWLRDTAEAHESAIVVTHAGVMRVLEAHHQRLPGAQWLDLRYDYGQVLALEWSAEQISAAPVQ